MCVGFLAWIAHDLMMQLSRGILSVVSEYTDVLVCHEADIHIPFDELPMLVLSRFVSPFAGFSIFRICDGRP